MVDTFSLADAASLGDLKILLGRSARIGCESVRLVGDSAVLAAYVAALASRGLLDASPTVLGLRTFALAGRDERFDVTVPVRAMLDRLAAHSLTTDRGPGPMPVPLPFTEQNEAWAGMSPPRSGWTRAGTVPSSLLEEVAREGAARVAAALPDRPGDSIAHRVRGEIWGAVIPGLETPVPAGVAFAAHSLGFLVNEDEASLHEAGRWVRVTTRRGHVLARGGSG